MTQIQDIRYLTKVQGLSYAQVKEITGCSYETIKKYEEMNDFTSRLTIRSKKTTKLDGFKEIIRKWISSDIGMPRKQRHTAKRIHDRLLTLYPETYIASYRTLCVYVNEVKAEFKLGKEEYLKLVHYEQEAQVDFGKVTFIEKGKEVSGSYLVMSFPYSNAGFIQIFRGETQECLLEGLKTIFKHIGRVPSEIWFDNLTAAVKLKNSERVLNDSFKRFCAHYNFKPVFCNPASGNEKGNVENKVGYLRRNLLVPIPNFVDINAFNKRLLKECDEDHNRVHYEKNLLIKDLLQEQLLKNQKVNEIDFEVFRLEKRIVNKYGNIELDTNSYSVNTSLRGTEVLVKIEANKLIILDSDYRKIIEHNRSFEKNQEIISYRESLDLIIKKINALENSQFYQKLPTVWKDFLKDKDKTQKRQYLKVLSKILIHDSLELATVVLQEAIKRSCLNVDSILTIYHNYLERDLIQETLKELPENTPLIDEYEINLGMYDKLMGGKRNEHSTL